MTIANLNRRLNSQRARPSYRATQHSELDCESVISRGLPEVENPGNNRSDGAHCFSRLTEKV